MRTSVHIIHLLPEDDTAAIETLSTTELEPSALGVASALLPWVELGSLTPLPLSVVVTDASLGSPVNEPGS